MDFSEETNTSQQTMTGMDQHQPITVNQQRQPSAKHQVRKEKALMYHHDMTSFNRENDYEVKANTILTNYFQHLTNITESIKDGYFVGSMFTFSQYTPEGTKTVQLQGVEPIYQHLMTLNVLTGYTPQEVVIQPSMGKGYFIIIRGTVQVRNTEPITVYQFNMSLNIVKVKKNYYILNQYFNIS